MKKMTVVSSLLLSLVLGACGESSKKPPVGSANQPAPVTDNRSIVKIPNGDNWESAVDIKDSDFNAKGVSVSRTFDIQVQKGDFPPNGPSKERLFGLINKSNGPVWIKESLKTKGCLRGGIVTGSGKLVSQNGRWALGENTGLVKVRIRLRCVGPYSKSSGFVYRVTPSRAG